MREPDSSVKFTKNDFSLSEQVSADATTVTVFWIDWARLFSKKSAVVGDTYVPVLGGLAGNRPKSYALYNLMNQNQGYDVIFYPQYETRVLKPVLGLGFITKVTTVKATARLGKLKD
jgi:hypothetical protein